MDKIKIKIPRDYDFAYFSKYVKAEITSYSDGYFIVEEPINISQELLEEALQNYNHQEYLNQKQLKEQERDLINYDISAGDNILNLVFKGNVHAQMSLTRKTIWALAVLNNNIISTTEEKLKAQEILIMSKVIDNEIENILKQFYPEEYEE